MVDTMLFDIEGNLVGKWYEDAEVGIIFPDIEIMKKGKLKTSCDECIHDHPGDTCNYCNYCIRFPRIRDYYLKDEGGNNE